MSDYFDAMKALKEMKCPMCYGHGGRIVHSGKPYRELQSCQDDIAEIDIPYVVEKARSKNNGQT